MPLTQRKHYRTGGKARRRLLKSATPTGRESRHSRTRNQAANNEHLEGRGRRPGFARPATRGQCTHKHRAATAGCCMAEWLLVILEPTRVARTDRDRRGAHRRSEGEVKFEVVGRRLISSPVAVCEAYVHCQRRSSPGIWITAEFNCALAAVIPYPSRHPAGPSTRAMRLPHATATG